MWTFAKMHANIYEPLIRDWNQSRAPQVQLLQLGLPAIERRMHARLDGQPDPAVGG